MKQVMATFVLQCPGMYINDMMSMTSSCTPIGTGGTFEDAKRRVDGNSKA